MSASLEVADIFRAAGPAYRTDHAGHLGPDRLKVMSGIETCRTATLGGHVEACDDVRAAVRLFFRNDELTVPAGRETIEARIQDAVSRAIMSQAGGLFDETIDGAAMLRAARFATEPFAELSPTERARLLSDAAGGKDVSTGRLDAEAARRVQNGTPAAAEPDLLTGVSPFERMRLEPAIDASSLSWADARQVLETNRAGELTAAFRNDAIREPIDLPYGQFDPAKPKSGWGYAKIAGKHPEVIDTLPEIIANLREAQRADNWIRLEDNRYTAVISTDFQGQKKTWLLTAFEDIRRQERQAPQKTIDRLQLAGETGSSPRPAAQNVVDPAQAAKPSPEQTRLTQLEREIGPETRLPFEQADGSMKEMTIAERMAEVEKQNRAAAELKDCIARNGGGDACKHAKAQAEIIKSP